jgi:hypothetical protein
MADIEEKVPKNPESASDEEKNAPVGKHQPYMGDLPPDPDAHLSAEERASIASRPRRTSRMLAHCQNRTANSSGSSI